jgi:hypothetical protein
MGNKSLGFAENDGLKAYSAKEILFGVYNNVLSTNTISAVERK